MRRQIYTAADIKVLSMEDSVRERPAMYFRVAREDPALPTEILRAVLSDALHLMGGDHAQAGAEITGDLSFTVWDDQPSEPGAGLLDRHRWVQAAAAALSVRTVVEVGEHRQELAGTTPTGPPERSASAIAGTRVSFELDPAYFPPHAAISSSIESVGDLHGEWCTDKPMPHTFRDLRQDP
ncbi:hypothetical protein SAMN05444920_104507 [Nonomuraea solani]|uniref:Uncharacterized protein n=1 Tax=Nonomuraea solani TaxID=1144553 RepID=A0A1H6CWV1_9ACTN|nr:hypothetical protein [Nonomuraea solani]SEG77589.1 hypothetical protein SAMN05444920_104507 [Nonomuraea solani]